MALLNKHHVKSLVAVGSMGPDGFVCDSTSFLVGFIAKEDPDPKKRLYRTFLVTNRHVFEARDKVTLRFNTDDGNIKLFDLDLNFPNGDTRWLVHPDQDVDLALLSINPSALKVNNIDPVFISEEIFAYLDDFEEIGISVGDDVYAIGFPMGIAGETQNYPCVKSGLISRIDAEIVRIKKAFLIDSSIFPGNSGGPVILKPQIASLSQSKTVGKPHLLGVISGYLSYSEKLYTHQTNPPTVASATRENSGLTFCVPITYAKEIYDKWLEENKPVEEPESNPAPDDVKEDVKGTRPE